MSLDKLKKLLEAQGETSDIYESTLNQIIESVDKELESVNALIDELSYSNDSSEVIVNKANHLKDHLTQALNFDNVEEDFDGTLSDLGPTPVAALGRVDARGGSDRLAGYAGLPKRRKSSKKRRKHEDTLAEEEYNFNIGDKVKVLANPSLGVVTIKSFIGAPTRKGVTVEDKDGNLKVYSFHMLKKATDENEDLDTELELLSQSKEELKKSLDNLKSNDKSSQNESLLGLTRLQGLLGIEDEKSSLIECGKTYKYLSDRKASIEKEMKSDIKATELSQLRQELAQVNKELVKLKTSEHWEEIRGWRNSQPFSGTVGSPSTNPNIPSYNASLLGEDKPEFEEGDEVIVIKGSNKGFKGTAKSSDVELKDLEDEFTSKDLVQQADIKPELGDYSGYKVIDTKDKVRKSRR